MAFICKFSLIFNSFGFIFQASRFDFNSVWLCVTECRQMYDFCMALPGGPVGFRPLFEFAIAAILRWSP